MTTIQITPWLQLIEGVAAISVPVILGLIATWTKTHFKLANGSAAANILDLFVTASSQAVVSAIAKAPTTAAPLDVKNATIAAILNDLSASTQAAMTLKNVTPASLAAKIDGAVQIALTVPVTPASPAPTAVSLTPKG
jgi:hypothetical protein